ncbi:MAG: DUF1573 domain-containing protein [Patescibacteria group bacterium]
MNKLIIVIVSILVLGAIVWYARPGAKGTSDPTETPTGPSILTSSEMKYDFGTISMKDGNISHLFTVTNTGTEAVTVSKLYTSCMCTTASIMNGTEKVGPFGMPGHAGIPSIKVVLEPGASTQVEAIFDPNAHGPAGVGKIERVVILENSAGKPLELAFSANVTP